MVSYGGNGRCVLGNLRLSSYMSAQPSDMNSRIIANTLRNVAKHFGMETVWFEEPWGLHAAWHYHKNWTAL